MGSGATAKRLSARLPGTLDTQLSIRSEGLLLSVHQGLTTAVATRRARRAVAESLPGDWQVSPIRSSPGLYQALRIRPTAQPLVRNVWDLARRLDAHHDVEWAEAAVIQPGHDPVPAQAGVRAPASGDRERLRPCAETPEWNLDTVRLREAFALPPGGDAAQGAGIRIAHPDTGYTRHPEIFDPARLAVRLGYDFEADRKDPKDPLRGRQPGHGTATASVIMSALGPADASAWVSGAAPRATLVPLRVSAGVVHFSFRRLVLAVDRAIDLECDIISMSLGGPFASRALRTVLSSAAGRGIILVAAAGNIWPWVVFPARLDDVIAVAASHCDDGIWRSSATGESVNLAAPGEGVWRARAEHPGRFTVAPGSGSSYAAATVAGAAAIWLSRHGPDRLRHRFPGARLPAVFRELLMGPGTRRPAGWDTARHGAGILDALGLVSAPLPRRGALAAKARASASTAVNTTSEFAVYFPGRAERDVAALLGRMLDAGAESDRNLVRYGDELRFHLATSPAFRSMASARRPSMAARAVRRHLERFGSRELRARLGA